MRRTVKDAIVEHDATYIIGKAMRRTSKCHSGVQVFKKRIVGGERAYEGQVRRLQE